MKRIEAEDIAKYGKFAVILKCLIERKNITQGELAKAVGLSEATITHYVKGRYTPSQAKLEKIAEYLNVPMRVFFGDIEDHTEYLNATEDNFAQRISTLIKENNITQEQLAKEIGVSRQTINMYSNGRQLPTTDILKKIADYFDITPDLLTEPMEKEEYSMKIYVDKLPSKKSDCVFLTGNYAVQECQLGGFCNLHNGVCPHLIAFKRMEENE